jgi:uncharacterized protein YerC
VRRYKFLNKDSVYTALNKLRAAFLAAKDGNDVEEIISGILTNDERIKIGRRIQIAQMLSEDTPYIEIAKTLKVGLTTVMQIVSKMQKSPKCFDLINSRESKVESEYQNRRYRMIGGSTLIFKKREYTGFTRKEVKR